MFEISLAYILFIWIDFICSLRVPISLCFPPVWHSQLSISITNALYHGLYVQMAILSLPMNLFSLIHKITVKSEIDRTLSINSLVWHDLLWGQNRDYLLLVWFKISSFVRPLSNHLTCFIFSEDCGWEWAICAHSSFGITPCLMPHVDHLFCWHTALSISISLVSFVIMRWPTLGRLGYNTRTFLDSCNLKQEDKDEGESTIVISHCQKSRTR